MNGISTDNHSFAMPILARWLGGMTQHVAVRQDCAGRSLYPAEARYSHSLIGRTTAGHGPNNCAATRRYLRRLAQSATPTAAEDKFYPQPVLGKQQNNKTRLAPPKKQKRPLTKKGP